MTLKSFKTLGDGNCLIHAILKSAFPDYQKCEDDFSRREIAKRFRELMGGYILKPDTDYPTIESVTEQIKKHFKTDNPRNFVEFIRCMYNYNIPYKFPNEKSKEQSEEEYRSYLENFSTENNLNMSNFNDMETEVKNQIESFKNNLEEKLGENLYLPNKFNEGVIEACLKGTDIPDGLYKDYPYNARIFTFCDFGTLVKLEMEYNKFDEVLFIRNMSRYFDSSEFIGDADVLPLVPDIMEINIIIIDSVTHEVISTYETKKSQRYVILSNRDNIHYETVGNEDEKETTFIFTRNSPIIQELFKK